MKKLTLLAMLFLFLNTSFSQQSLDSLRLVLPVGHVRVVPRIIENKKYFISCSHDNSAKVWDRVSGSLLYSFDAHSGPINDLVYDSLNNRFLTVSEDSTIRYWNFKRNEGEIKPRSKLKDCALKIILSYSSSAYYVLEGRDVISKWNLKNDKLISRIKVSDSEIYSINYDNHSRKIIALMFDGSILSINENLKNKRDVMNLAAHKSLVYRSFFLDDKNFFTASFDGDVLWWNTAFISGKRKIQVSNDVINDFKITKNSKLLIAGSNDNFVHVINLEDTAQRYKIEFDSWVFSIDISEEKKFLIAGSKNGQIKLVNLQTGFVEREISTNTNLESIKLVQNGSLILCSFSGGDILLLSADNLQIKIKLTNEVNPPYNFLFDNKGNLATANDFSDYYFINLLRNEISGFVGEGIADLSFPDSRNNFLLASDNSIEVFGLESNKKVKTKNFENGLVTLAGYSKSGRTPYTVFRDQGLCILERLTLDSLFIIKKSSGYNYVLTCAFLNNDSIIAIGETESGLVLANTYSGESESLDLNLDDSEENDIFYLSETRQKGQLLAVSGFSILLIDVNTKKIVLKRKIKNKVISAILVDTFIFLGYSNGTIEKIGLKDFKIIDSYTVNSSIKRIFGLENKIAVLTNNGRISFYDNSDFKLLFSFILLVHKNYILQLPNSPYYMCSKDASKMLHYVTPSLRVIGFEQLDPVYNRPDIVLDSIGKYFGNADQGLVANYRQSWEKRINQLGLDKEKIGKGEIAVPNAEIVGADAIQYENKNGKLEINVSANDPKYILNRFNVYVNEVPIYGSAGISIARLKKQIWDTTVSVPLSLGENKIQVSVMNELGLENFKYPTYVNYTPTKEIVAKTYYIGIGVNEFRESSHNLKYCVKDVTDLSTSFGGPNTEVKLFTNAQVTKENILALKDYLAKTTVNDIVIISCSSHGLLDDSLNFYLAMHDVDFKNPKVRGIKYEELENLLDSIPARQKLLLLDACNSGENDKSVLMKTELSQKEAKLNGSEVLAARGVIVQLEDENKSNFKKMNELFVNVRNNTGSVIISAAGGQESALEAITVDGKSIENGAFSYCVLEYLKNNSNKPKKLTVNQLKSYVEKRVEEITNGKQQPTSRQETMEIDWGLR